MDKDQRIKAALEVAVNFGGADGEHHLKWVIDQMVRSLTGCPNNVEETEEYQRLVVAAKAGQDGPETYDWDCGIAP